ncbi:MAG: hypothetical protein A3F72_20930 [Bacteroidetes bacterium RIFCSPLOWO2_12_FULL_35_15]|nr:MAG: hypothetical protein A3F72_20930 [Bacteroidetes bacterium RIFCSPLOWO2_12_FULL_35_15]
MDRKKLIKIFFCGLFIFAMQLIDAQNIKQDSLKSITTIGIFDGKKIMVGNFETEEVYKINEYCIFPASISEQLADSLKGKKILVTGKLKIVEGKTMPVKTSTDSRIYEPYNEPDKKFIIDPLFTIVYDTREPLIKRK